MLSWIYVQYPRLFWISLMSARWHHLMSSTVWMKGVYFECFKILFVSAHLSPLFSGRNLNTMTRPFYFIPGMATFNSAHTTHKIWDNAECRDVFIYLFSWMDLMWLQQIIPLHNIKHSYNCRQDWGIIDYCNSACLLLHFSWIYQGKQFTWSLLLYLYSFLV